MTEPINGSDVVVYVDGSAVGYQTDVTFEETTEEIDVSSKEERAKRVLPGRYGANVSLDALYVSTDTAFQALQSAMRNGEFVTLARYSGETNVEEANAIITSMSETFPDQEGATISASFTVDGEWAVPTP